MHTDVTPQGCPRVRDDVSAARRADEHSGVQCAIATLESLIAKLEHVGDASTECTRAPCGQIIAPPSTPCDARSHDAARDVEHKRHCSRWATRARGARISLTEMSLMDLARAAAERDARDVMTQSVIRGDRLLHSERTSNKRKAQSDGAAPSCCAKALPLEMLELRSRHERLTLAMKNLNLNLRNAASFKKK